MEVICPEHGKICIQSNITGNYICTHSNMRSTTDLCGWSVSEREAHLFARKENVDVQRTNQVSE